MTLNDILVSALTQLDRGHDAQTLDVWREKLTRYANDALADLTNACKPRRSQRVELLDGLLDTNLLEKRCLRVLEILEDGRALAFEEGGQSGVLRVTNASSNPYFLQVTAGVSRDQLSGAARYATDRAIQAAISANPDLIGAGLYVLPDGSVSSVYSQGALSVAAVRTGVLAARGLPATVSNGFAASYAPVPAPEYYRPVAGAQAASASLPGTFLPAGASAQTAAAAKSTAKAGVQTAAQGVYQSYYEQILEKLSVPELALPQTYGEGQMAQMLSSFLRPQADRAIARRREELEQEMAELDADAVSRGMGASTFVSSLKQRQQSAAQSDISSIESEYEAALAQRIYEALNENDDRMLAAQKFNLEQQASAQQTAVKLAADWYEAWLREQSSGKKKSSGKSVKPLSSSQYEAYVALLSKAEVGALAQGGGVWKDRKTEMVRALGSSGFDALIRKYSK